MQVIAFMIEEKLIQLSKKIGRYIPLWTQGPGGNVSCKVVEKNYVKLLIKASGKRIDQLSISDGLLAMQCSTLKERLLDLVKNSGTTDSEYGDCVASCMLKAHHNERPSMETGFHAVLPGAFVLHFHSLPAMLMAHEYAKNTARMRKWLEMEWPGTVCFLQQIRPGWLLTKSVINAPDSSLYILKNHGVIISHNDPEILDIWERIEMSFCRFFGHEVLLNLFSDTGVTRAAQAISNHPTPLRIFFPDAAVFLQKIMRLLKPVHDFNGEHYYVLRDSAWIQDRNEAEIWLAIQALYKTCPELDEIDPSLASEIIGLPSERFRESL